MKKLSDKAYYEKNREKILAKKKEYYKKNIEKFKLKGKKYAEKNKEKIKQYQETYRASNRDKSKDYQKTNRKKNSKQINQRRRELYLLNQEKIKQTRKEHYQKNKEKLLARAKKWRENNKAILENYKEKRNEIIKKRKLTDPLFKLKCNIKRSISNAFINKNIKKTSKTLQILGCTFNEFKSHLEAQFKPWMDWDNHGKYNGQPNFGWDIDHIIPLATATTEEELIRLNHYTNLQPLDSQINRDIKKDKIIL